MEAKSGLKLPKLINHKSNNVRYEFKKSSYNRESSLDQSSRAFKSIEEPSVQKILRPPSTGLLPRIQFISRNS